MFRRVVVAMSVLVLSALSALIAAPAEAAPVPVSFWVGGAAQLSADHSTLTLAFTYRCPRKYGGSRGYGVVAMQVTQRLTSGGQAFGIDTDGVGIDLVCDGRWRHGSHTVTASVRAYQAGDAWLASSLLFCDAAELNCLQLERRRTVVVAAR